MGGDEAPPSFIQKPQLHQEDEGNVLIFECKLLGSPKPDVRWFRGDKELIEDQRTTIRVSASNRIQIRLSNLPLCYIEFPPDYFEFFIKLINPGRNSQTRVEVDVKQKRKTDKLQTFSFAAKLVSFVFR